MPAPNVAQSPPTDAAPASGPTPGLAAPDSPPSQTAQDFIASQLRLEADARAALPYQFDTCTQPMGPLRQSVYACLTCTPAGGPACAGVCYSCSISCHGAHELVELFVKRDFVCDCGTTRMGDGDAAAPCSLRLNAATGRRGGVRGEQARAGNAYNQNFRGAFCGCGDAYDPTRERSTMFQCLGLGTVEDGGCGEDWWHPECLLGLPREGVPAGTCDRDGDREESGDARLTDGAVADVADDTGAADDSDVADHSDVADELPKGFPHEDDFDYLICYKCVDAFPWIKKYAGSRGFLVADPTCAATEPDGNADHATPGGARKRKAEDDLAAPPESKKPKPEPTCAEPAPKSETTGAEPAPKSETTDADPAPIPNGPGPAAAPPRHASLPPAPPGRVTLFLRADFRAHLCRCACCFPLLAAHRTLLEDEDTYSPPVSESSLAADDDDRGLLDDGASTAGRSVGSGSLLERGEAALSGWDRARAIQGAMAYNHVRDSVKTFLRPYAESGQPVGAEDIKAYFAKLRGDGEMGAKEANAGAESAGAAGDGRQDQSGY